MAGSVERAHPKSAAGIGGPSADGQSLAEHQIDPSPEAEDAAFHAGQVVSISLGHAIHDTYTGFLPPLLPVFISSLALSNTQAGLLSVFLQAPSVLQPVIGRAADRLDLSRIIVVAPILTAVAMSLLGPAPSYALIAGLLLLAGLSSASFHAIAPVMAGRASGERLGRGMGFWMVGGELGRVLGPLVVVTMVRFLTVRGTPWLMIPGFVGALAIWRYYGRSTGRRSEQKVSSSGSWHQVFRGRAKGLAPIIGIVIVRACMTAALGVFLPTFLTSEGSDLWLAGMALSLYQVTGVVGALAGGALSDRWGRRSVLLFSLLATPALLMIFLSTAGLTRLLILPLLGLASLCINPVMMALVQETFPENRALANGLYSGLGFILRSAAVLTLGAIGDSLGLRTAFWAAAFVPLAGIPLLSLVPRRNRGALDASSS